MESGTPASTPEVTLASDEPEVTTSGASARSGLLPEPRRLGLDVPDHAGREDPSRDDGKHHRHARPLLESLRGPERETEGIEIGGEMGAAGLTVGHP